MMCEDSPNQSVAPYLCWQFAVFLQWCKRLAVRGCHAFVCLLDCGSNWEEHACARTHTHTHTHTHTCVFTHRIMHMHGNIPGIWLKIPLPGFWKLYSHSLAPSFHQSCRANSFKDSFAVDSCTSLVSTNAFLANICSHISSLGMWIIYSQISYKCFSSHCIEWHYYTVVDMDIRLVKSILAHCFIRGNVSFCVCVPRFVCMFAYVYSHGCLGQVIQPGAQQHK